MKYITKYKSANYNLRNYSKIKLIIIHYTALESTQEAISYLCKKEKKVSSHYLISQDGAVYNLVQDKFRAWHAGQSYWQGETDINSISIGIELDYSSKGNNNKFSLEMILSLKKLIHKLKKTYSIDRNSILAHSDIAPFRKKDPGKYFPWETLSSSKIVLDIKKLKKSDFKIIEEWFNNYNIQSKKKIIILALSLIGYDTRKVHSNSMLYNKLIKSYRIRYLNFEEIKKNKSIYNKLIQHLFSFMLTKN